VNTTYDVRIQGIRVQKGVKRNTYTFRWVVAKERFGKSFATKALAESFRSTLLVAHREGVAFDVDSGLPESVARKAQSRSWITHSMNFVDMKWVNSSPKHRRNTAEALVTVTLAFLSSERAKPSNDDLRAVLYGWAFNASTRKAYAAKHGEGKIPDEFHTTMKWLSHNTFQLSQLEDAALMRKALDALSLRLDGKPAAASTIARKRTALSSALKYAIELRLLE
jgi:hypothetical protein